jgi:putative sigma-54 modulation protein
MLVNIKGKNIEVTDRLKTYVDKKIGKLDHYLPGISEAWVELRVEDTKAAQDRQVCQVTLRTDRTILRAEERSDDMFAAIDAVLTKIYRQIDRYKGKRKNRWRSTATAAAGADVAVVEAEEDEEVEEPGSIVRTKRFPVRPVSADEAIEQMELLGHDFYVFYNAEAGEINVLYRRKDGNYGLLQPEVG